MPQRDVNFIIRARDDASKAFDRINQALAELAGVQQTVERGSGEMGAALGRSSSAAENLASSLSTDTERAASQVEAAFNRISESVDQSRTRLEAQQAELQESEANYRALTAQLEAARSALSSFRNVQGPIRPEDVNLVEQAERGVRALEGEVRRAESAWTRQSQVVADASQEFNRLEAQAAGARTAINSVANTRVAPTNVEGAVQAQRRVAAAFREATTAGQPARATIRDVIRELTRMPSAANGAAQGMQRAARAAFDMRNAFRAFYGDSRRALSLMQRIRGEVLALTASFVGFYAIFEQGNRVFDAFRTLEQAQNRLGAAFQQNTALVSAEISFLQDEAQRLGFSFESLSDNYSKFLISAQAANFTTEQTRDIFTSVTEAARVMNLSTDQVSGALTALTQIAGKGTVQMEELRQQLGDRIPGAVAIMAAGLGFAGDELDEFYKLVENGNVSAQQGLVAFAEELDRRFGGQLQQALQSVTAEVGRFQDNLFNARLTAAGAGFIDGLTEALQELNVWLTSTEGIQFFEGLGAAAGNFLRIIPTLVQNMELFGRAIQVIVAIKLAQFFGNVGASMRNLTGSTIAARRAVVTMNRAFATYAPTLAAAASRSAVFSGALRTMRPLMIGIASTARAMWLAIGGPIGLITTAVTFFAQDALFSMFTQVEQTNDVLDRHNDIVREIRNAYIRAADGAKDWRESLEDITEIEIASQLQELRRQLQEFRQSPENTLNTSRGSAPETRTLLQDRARTPEERELVDGLLDADRAFSEARISAADFLEVIENVREVAPELIPVSALNQFVKVAQEGRQMEQAIAEAEAAIRVIQGTASEADLVILGLAEATEESATQFEDAGSKLEDFRGALDELAKNIPSLKAQLDRFDSIEKIEQQFQNALIAARALPDEILRVAAAQEALSTRQNALDNVAISGLPSGFAGAGNGVEAAASLIRQREGFRSTPYFDVNAFRAGFGSDTITLSDGTIQRVVQGMRVTQEDANRDLYRRITTEFLPAARNAVGPETFDRLTPQQQAVLTSLSYNYGAGAFSRGETLAPIANAIREGLSDAQVANLIRARAGDNNGVNAGRRNEEAAIFAQGVGSQAAIDRAEEARQQEAEDQQERLEREREFNEELAAGVAQRQFETELQDASITDREVALALRRAELDAQKAGTELTKEQRDEIEASVRASTAKRQAEEEYNAALERGKQLDEEVNLLQERRRFLLEQQQDLVGNGDLVGAARVTEELEGVESELDQAIIKAREFWAAMGGEDAEQALFRLRQTEAELRTLESTAVTTGRQINEMFAEKGTEALDRFAQSVANGEDPLAALGRAFQQMAAEILIELGRMIIQQSLFNALSGGSPGGQGGVGGFVSGLVNSIFHSGGIAGRNTGGSRAVNMAQFAANAIRYHSGGVAGLRPDEVPAVLQQGEEILTEGDPRHRNNGGIGGADGLTIINSFDAEEVVERAFSMPRGQRALVNAVRGKNTEIKAALG